MMKKLLLLAILAPVAMQPVMKANLTQVLTNIARPWSETANISVRAADGFQNSSFNLKLDVITAILSVGSFAYSCGFNQPLRGSHSRANSFIVDYLPRILAGHEVYKRGTTLAWNSRPHDPLSYLISLTKIFICFADKLPSREMRNAFGRRINLAMPN